jgi:hypothetical protein
MVASIAPVKSAISNLRVDKISQRDNTYDNTRLVVVTPDTKGGMFSRGLA